MIYLVDADVLSEGTKPQPDPAVLRWLERNCDDIVVNPIVLGELEYGILHLPEGRRRASLRRWFADHARCLTVVDMDADTATHWAALLEELRRRGCPMPLKDSLIAASARQHGLTVATRNTRDFAQAGVDLVNPFQSDQIPE